MNYINPFNQLSGIYRILNKINGNCYIGSSLNVEFFQKNLKTKLEKLNKIQLLVKKPLRK